ncbi:MAG TPA: hypothetical protein VHR84_19320 [Terriglobales bacterium]|jgi:hypothetical protein|nr:hypothetical protein [Terriglobales bacterium]
MPFYNKESDNKSDGLQKEISNLLDRQTDALKTATFLGMTREEARDYDDRRSRINHLIQKLYHLDPPK